MLKSFGDNEIHMYINNSAILFVAFGSCAYIEYDLHIRLIICKIKQSYFASVNTNKYPRLFV